MSERSVQQLLIPFTLESIRHKAVSGSEVLQGRCSTFIFFIHIVEDKQNGFLPEVSATIQMCLTVLIMYSDNG